MELISLDKFGLFVHRDIYRWLGLLVFYDDYSVCIEIVALTVGVGIEFIWKRPGQPKTQIDRSIMRQPK